MIFSMTKRTVKPNMYALSTLIFVVVLLLLVLSNLLGKDESDRPKKHSPKKRKHKSNN